MLVGDAASADDNGARGLRAYLSTAHATHPELGCVLPTLGAEIARADPAVRATVEQWLKRTQKSWQSRVGDADAAWSLMAQRVGALVLSRVMESERTRSEVLSANRRFLTKLHDLSPRRES